MRPLNIGDKIRFIDALMNNLTMYKFKICNHEDLIKTYTNDPNYYEFEFCFTCGDKIAFFLAHDFHAKAIEIHSADIVNMQLEVTSVDDMFDIIEEY